MRGALLMMAAILLAATPTTLAFPPGDLENPVTVCNDGGGPSVGLPDCKNLVRGVKKLVCTAIGQTCTG